jgi:hypothetical protein
VGYPIALAALAMASAASDGVMIPVPGEGTEAARAAGTAGGGGPALGPLLFVDMGETALIAALNAWGAARDREVLELKINLGVTQEKVSAAFEQARDTLLQMIVDFRGEAEMQRAQGQYAAGQSIARLEQVVTEARTRFDAQDSRFSEGLSELARRQQAVETWAQGEPTRIAAIVQATPAPPRSPGGTPLTFYPSPSPAQAPATPTPRAEQPQPTASPAAAQAAAPVLDAWAAYLAQPTSALPGGPRHFDMSTPGGGGGKGGGYPYRVRVKKNPFFIK